MPTFQKCPDGVREMADSILAQFETHEPVLAAKVKIDYLFAYAKRDDAGNKVGNALSLHGNAALGICRKMSLKHRAMGRGDVEISLDGDWWEKANEQEQRALLDHELHHIAVKLNEKGVVRDDLERPVIQMRKHDHDFGWFQVIAARHGMFSAERQQARQIMEEGGQYYWPELASIAGATPLPIKEMAESLQESGTTMTISSGKSEVVIDAAAAKRIIKSCDAIIAGQEPAAQEEDEDLIQQCIEVIRSEQKASVSLLQRRLRLGYTRAARIMDELESRGIVGPEKGAEPRDILI